MIKLFLVLFICCKRRGSAAVQVDVDNTGRSLDQDAATTSFNAQGTTELDDNTMEGS